MRLRHLLRTLLVCALALSMNTSAAESVALAAPGPQMPACAGSETPANLVVHYYLALDDRRFAAAYACLDPSVRGPASVAAFARGYATTVASHLLVADQLPDGRVWIVLQAVDRQGSQLVATIFSGYWRVSADGVLLAPHIQEVRREVVPAVPTNDGPAILAMDNQRVLQEAFGGIEDRPHYDEPTYFFLTQGPYGAQVWLFNRNRLVFAETVPGASDLGMGSLLNDYKTFFIQIQRNERIWTWTPIGFTRLDYGWTMSLDPDPARVGQRVAVGGVTLGRYTNFVANRAVYLERLSTRLPRVSNGCVEGEGSDLVRIITRQAPPTDDFSFRVPSVPPGIYKVVVSDHTCHDGLALAVLIIAP